MSLEINAYVRSPSNENSLAVKYLYGCIRDKEGTAIIITCIVYQHYQGALKRTPLNIIIPKESFSVVQKFKISNKANNRKFGKNINVKYNTHFPNFSDSFKKP